MLQFAVIKQSLFVKSEVRFGQLNDYDVKLCVADLMSVRSWYSEFEFLLLTFV